MRPRENPFRAQRLDGLSYRFSAGTSADSLLERFFRLGARAAIVGPHGHGKSTLLRALAAALHEQGYEVRRAILRAEAPRLTPAERRNFLAALTPRTVLFLDGAEQLGEARWALLRLRARRAGGLLITTHRPGRLPTLFECRTSPELLNELVETLAPGLVPEASVRELFKGTRGNVRESLRTLYERVGERAG